MDVIQKGSSCPPGARLDLKYLHLAVHEQTITRRLEAPDQYPLLYLASPKDRVLAMIEESPLFKYNITNKLYKQSLLNSVCLVAGVSIFFFGYDQGLMGGVILPLSIFSILEIGPWKLTRVTQIAVYYLPGTLCGCLLGGWFGDHYGRIVTIGLGAIWSIIGACLQCSAQNATWMYCGSFPRPGCLFYY